MKELKVRYSVSRPNAYEVYYEGGGEVPDVLKGGYTSPALAQKAIDFYLQAKPKKVKKGEE